MNAEHTQNTLSSHADIQHKCMHARDACASTFVFAEWQRRHIFQVARLHAYLTHVAMPTKILSVCAYAPFCVCASTPIYVCVYKSPHLLYMAPPPCRGSAQCIKSARTAFIYVCCAAEPSKGWLALLSAIIATSFIALLFQSSKSHPSQRVIVG
jgi:hypothetical protein